MRVIIGDDHAIVRRGLQQIIASERPGWPAAAEAATADALLRAVRETAYDVVVLDIVIGARSGIDVLAHLRAEFPHVPVLMLSMHAEEQYAIRCLRAGAAGYIQKDRPPEALIDAIERVGSGRRYVSEAVAEQLAIEVSRRDEAPLHERLSDREFEVFRMLAGGLSPTLIAETLHVSAKTVSTYRARIMAKTGFRSNAEMIRYAIDNRIV